MIGTTSWILWGHLAGIRILVSETDRRALLLELSGDRRLPTLNFIGSEFSKSSTYQALPVSVIGPVSIESSQSDSDPKNNPSTSSVTSLADFVFFPLHALDLAQ